MQPQIQYDREANAVYIQLRDLPYAYGEDIDHERRIDYAADGQPIGVELLDVRGGVELGGLPESELLAALLEREAIRIFA